MGDSKKPKKRSITPPPMPASVQFTAEVDEEVEDWLKTFDDTPKELLKRFETALRKEIRWRMKSEHDKNYYKTRAERSQAEAKREKNKRRRLQVPMTIRCYVDKIEIELGGGLPFLSQADIAGKKSREIEILKRARLWESYLKDKQSSTYISDILAELKTAYDEFKLVRPTVTYEVFCRDFCLAIGRVHKQVSERIAHGLDGNSRRVKILKRFDKQTDRYMTIFYNATIGYDKDSDSESEVDLGAGSENDN